MATHPVFRALHDVGLAAWTGGALMGAVGLNGAVVQVDDPTQRARAGTAGWTRWAPVNGAAVGGHVVGAVGLLVTDWPRVRSQRGVAASSAAKAATTGVSLGLAAWSFVLNRKMAQAGAVPVRGATEPAPGTPADVAATLRQLQLVQWANPVVGLSLIGLSAWQSEQQRTSEVVQGTVQRLLSRRSASGPAVAGLTAVAALGLLARRRRAAGQQRNADLPVSGAASAPSSSDVATSPAAPVGVGTATGPAAADTQAPAVTSDLSGDARTDTQAPGDSVTRSREQLQVDTETVESGRATVRKQIVTEPVTETVTLRHEEPVLKREPITDDNLEAALDGPDLSEEEHEVVLHAEEPVVSKETVPVERVEVGTTAVTEQQHVTDTVREEHVDVGDDTPGGR